MDRSEFLAQVGLGAAALLIPTCIGGLTGCAATPVADFTLDVSTGPLAANGGFLVHDGVIVARTNTGTFIAVSAACTHEGTTINYNAANNNFVCPNHGAKFNSTGAVTLGPASTNLTSYHTTLSGTSLHVFS